MPPAPRIPFQGSSGGRRGRRSRVLPTKRACGALPFRFVLAVVGRRIVRGVEECDLIATEDSPELLVLGKGSYIGAWILQQAAREGAPTMGVGRDDCDLRDAHAVRALFRGLDSRPRSLVLLAARNKPNATDHESWLENTAIARSVAAGCSEANIQSIVYLSSVDVYGLRAPIPITERTPVDPDTWYGLAKYVGEWILRRSGSVQVPVAVLRIPGVYGPASNDRSVVGQMMRDARTTGAITIRGSGNALRDYVHLSDLYHVVARLARLRYDGVLNVATGRSRAVRDIATLTGRVLGHDVRLLFRPKDGREFDLSFDTALLRSVLPDFRFQDLPQGMATYLETVPANA